MNLKSFSHFSSEKSSPSALFQPSEKQLWKDEPLKPMPVIILSGPTAVGKTDLSLQLAQTIDAEIVSADSMQVYRGMDIGTAKPTLEQREKVVHHLIDVRDIKNPLNVAQYYAEALAAIQDIHSRGKIPVVVGGSGFYISALLRGAPSGPPADQAIRAYLYEQMQKLGPEHLYQHLCKHDPIYAQTITKGDRHKIVRALEIMMITQKPVSEQKKHTPHVSPAFDFHCYFLCRNRDDLYARINQRCDEMIRQGFIQEISHLVNEGLLENNSAANAIGYRQGLDYLRSNQDEASFNLFRLQFQQASRHYAKRQFTWFRKETSFKWFELEQYSEQQLVEIITRHL